MQPEPQTHRQTRRDEAHRPKPDDIMLKQEDPAMRQQPEQSAAEWAEHETARRIREEYHPPEEPLLPPEAFRDTPATTNDEWSQNADDEHRAPSIRARLSSTTCGWRNKPTMDELAAAMTTANPTRRQLCVANVIIAEATTDELFQGYLDRLYTMRQLVQRMHDLRATKTWRTRTINRWRQRS